MDHEPWRESDEEGWKLPRSFRDVRERWQGDSVLRLVIGIGVLIAVMTFLAVARLSL
jgi:hypothetical protein